MPITLGILAQARQAPVAAGSYDLLESVLLSSPAATVSFTNLATTYASTYKHLQIRAVMKSSRTGGSAELYGTANGLTSYRTHWLQGSFSAVASASTSYSKMFFGNIASSDTSNDFAVVVIDILDAFNTNKNKTTRTMNGMTGSVNRISLQSSLILTTDALTSFSLEIEPASNFVTGTRISLYGVK